jgi:hypothetical protein
MLFSLYLHLSLFFAPSNRPFAMGKAGKDRKRKRLLAEVATTGIGAHRLKADQENLGGVAALSGAKDFTGVVSDEDMAVTLRTLVALEKNTEVYRSKSCRALRSTIHQLQQTATAHTGTGNEWMSRNICSNPMLNKKSSLMFTNPSYYCHHKLSIGQTPVGRISDALVDGRWADATTALEEMRARGQVPKLGALQRWVRDCDAASAKSGAFGDPIVLRLLDSILRTVDPSMVPKRLGPDGGEEHPVRTHPMWQPFPRVEDNVQKYEAALAKTLFSKSTSSEHTMEKSIQKSDRDSDGMSSHAFLTLLLPLR